MSISPGPFITCLLTALILNIYILFIIHVKKDILYEGMRFTFGVIVLILLRMMIPLNFPFTITIPFAEVLPRINIFLNYNIGNTDIKICHVLIILWLIEAVRRLICMGIGNRDYRRYLAPFLVKNISEYPDVLELLNEYHVSFMQVYMVPAAISPELFGARNTVLVLPKDMLSKEELLFACRHELEHYKNHDLWLKLFVDLTVCIQWFNPLVYILRQELILAFEMANDREVMRDCTELQRAEYMLFIIRLSKIIGKEEKRQKGLSFIKRNDFNLKQRVDFLSSKDYGKTKMRGASVLLRYVLVTVMLMVAFVFVPEGYIPKNLQDSEAVKVHEDNSYLVECEEGYQLYINGSYLYTCSTIHDEFNDLPIIKEEEVE